MSKDKKLGSENTTVAEDTTTAEVVSEPEPEPVAAEAPVAATKGTECGHPSNPTGYHQKAGDGKCRYCGA